MQKNWYEIGQEFGDTVNTLIANFAYAAGLGDYTLSSVEGSQEQIDQDAKNCEEFFKGFSEVIVTKNPW